MIGTNQPKKGKIDVDLTPKRGKDVRKRHQHLQNWPSGW